jgi:hypothetical protein
MQGPVKRTQVGLRYIAERVSQRDGELALDEIVDAR